MFIRKQCKMRQYPFGLMYAADETAVWAGASGDTTVDLCGVQEVPIRGTGSKKFRLTVLLCAREDGKKEKPFVLLNRKREVPALKQYERSLNLVYQGTNWMNDELTIDFIHRTFPRTFFQNRLLVWDSFKCHFSEKVKAEMNKIHLDTEIIPGGCTGFIQPPDVSWNKPFKAAYREHYENWCASGNLPMTAGGNPKPPPLENVCEWIRKAWESVTKEIIVKSFRICGISLKTTGEEDDEIECFKEGHSCKEGRELLRTENEKIQHHWSEMRVQQEIIPTEFPIGLEDEAAEVSSDEELVVDT